ncbi:MAG: uracil phosphoribosyltransferase [Fimbriimonadales bacterium]|nr:uracil phosphoribosyltransferase [Fimbriimonadales bacterium]
MSLRCLDHPLAAHLVAVLRRAETPPERFRAVASDLSRMLALEATRYLRTRTVEIQGPLETTTGEVLDEPIAAVPILRAGLGLLEPIAHMFPDVTVGYIGLERDERTAIARSYYCKLPNLQGRFTLVIDPMLATGGSASQAISFVKGAGAERVCLLCVVAAPQGVRRLESDHPDVEIVTAAVDRDLDGRKYILPGLGDFGDRLYGTV